MSEEEQDWLEAAWEDREERIYPEYFGPIGNQIYPLSAELFTKTFKQDSIDPCWLNHGVFESAPNPKHRSWLYVTSGLSNAWGDEHPDPTDYSGVGCEFVLECPTQAKWAIIRLQHLLAFQILISVGRYPSAELLDSYDRIPLRGSISPEPSLLTHLMLAPPPEQSDGGYPASFQLASGTSDLLAVVGVTEAEVGFARKNGGAALVERLREAGAFPVTDPARGCTVQVPSG